MANTRWISRDPERRARKYLVWYWIELHRRAKRWPEKFSPEAIADIQKYFDAEKSQFEFMNGKGKPDLARQWYEPEVLTIYDLFKEVGLESVYIEAYKTLSGTEHSDVMAYFQMFANAEKKDGETKLGVQNDSFAFHSFQFLLLSLAPQHTSDTLCCGSSEFHKAAGTTRQKPCARFRDSSHHQK